MLSRQPELSHQAAKRATTTIPIVMTAAGDPLGSGLVASLARPGGNVTDISLMASDLGAKRLELLKEVLPKLSRVAVQAFRKMWNISDEFILETRPTMRDLVTNV